MTDYVHTENLDYFVSNITASGYQAATTLSRITIDKVELRLKGETKGTYPCGGKRYAKNKIILNANIVSESESFYFDEVRLIASGSDNLVFSSIKANNGVILDLVAPNKVAVILNFNLSYQTIEKDFVYISQSSDNNMTEVQEHSLYNSAHAELFNAKINKNTVIDSYNVHDNNNPASAKAAHDLDRIISSLVGSIKNNEITSGTQTHGDVTANFTVRKFKNGLKQMEVTYMNVTPTHNPRNANQNTPIWASHGGFGITFWMPQSFERIITRVQLFGENLAQSRPNTPMYGEFDEWLWAWELYAGDFLNQVPIYFRRWVGDKNERMNLTVIVEGY